VQDHLDTLKKKTSEDSDVSTLLGVAPFNFDKYASEIDEIILDAQLQWYADNPNKAINPQVNKQIHMMARPEVDAVLERIDADVTSYKQDIKDRAKKELNDKVLKEQEVKREVEAQSNSQASLKVRFQDVIEKEASLDTDSPSIFPFVNSLTKQLIAERSEDIEGDLRRMIPLAFDVFTRSVEENSDSIDPEVRRKLREIIDVSSRGASEGLTPEVIDSILSGEFMQEGAKLTEGGAKGYAEFVKLMAEYQQ
jgi:hypothetical protein